MKIQVKYCTFRYNILSIITEISQVLKFVLNIELQSQIDFDIIKWRGS